MTDTASCNALLAAVDDYFELMFTSNVALFERVFAPSAHLHGLRDGALRALPAPEYRKLLADTPSPRAKEAPRRQEVLLVDVAAPTQALVKVRVRIDTILYLDYLAFHLIDGAWRITAKSFHIEQRFDRQPAS